MPIHDVSVKSAVIGGSSGFRFLQNAWNGLEKLGSVTTPFGESAPVHKGSFEGREFLFMSRHGESGYNVTASFVNYRANIWALKELGVERIVAWSGPAAIDPAIKVGEIVVPGDLIDETKRRDYTFFDGLGLGFIRQSPVFCAEMTKALASAAEKRFGACRDQDVYVCTEGPRLETPAEIRKFSLFGGSLVGMTLVPEVFLAKELEICYAAICYITNYAESVRERAFTPGVLFEGLLDESERRSVDDAVAKTAELAVSVVTASQSVPRTCACSEFMERYRRRGDIDQDWRKWITKNRGTSRQEQA